MSFDALPFFIPPRSLRDELTCPGSVVHRFTGFRPRLRSRLARFRRRFAVMMRRRSNMMVMMRRRRRLRMVVVMMMASAEHQRRDGQHRDARRAPQTQKHTGLALFHYFLLIVLTVMGEMARWSHIPHCYKQYTRNFAISTPILRISAVNPNRRDASSFHGGTPPARWCSVRPG